jgi:hypothetical protein
MGNYEDFTQEVEEKKLFYLWENSLLQKSQPWGFAPEWSNLCWAK